MQQYNFETLNSVDFEYLVRDLLNADAKAKGNSITYSCFPEGKDRGIDLLDNDSKPGEYNIIVQVKHQPNIVFTVLLTALSRSTKTHKSELEKIEELRPNRYIFVTSRPLTLLNREEIVKAMSPYIHSLNDIIDKEEVNRLLSEHPEIETKHQKLWFSSVPVFERILHNDVHERSDQLAQDIRKKLRLYVPVNDLNKALTILKTSKFIVIIGEPGCGKTTFAEIILHKLAGMEFTSYWIDKSVGEIDSQLKNDESKQVFYFDDFLGHTRYEIEQGRIEEKGLLHFLKRIISLKNKYFILTTRTSLINAAALDSERFRSSDIFTDKYEIKVQELSTDDKVQMIINHLDVREVPNAYITWLTNDCLVAIAQHYNFSPRIIEFVTHSNNYKKVLPCEYFEYIITQLENPHEVWLHAYEQQIDEYDQFLLTTLYSFGEAVKECDLEIAYEDRLCYEIQFNNIVRKSGTFRRSLKKLLGSFVTLKRYFEGERLEFINPSLEDFFSYYLKVNDQEKLRILNSFRFAEQIYHRFRLNDSNHLSIRPGKIFRNRIEGKVSDTTRRMDSGEKEAFLNLYSAMIYRMFFNDEYAIDAIISFLEKVNWKTLNHVNYFHLSTFLTASLEDLELRSFIARHFYDIVICLIKITPRQYLENTKNFFNEFDVNYTLFIADETNRSTVKSDIDFYFEDEIFAEIESMGDTVLNLEDVGEIRETIEHEILTLYGLMEIDSPANLHGFDEVNWESICANNLFVDQMRKDDDEAGPIRFQD